MSRPSTFKRCGCRDPRTGRRLGNTCPRLRRCNGTGSWSADHGTWHYRLELPATVDGARRPLRRGGFATRTAAQAERDHIASLLRIAGGYPPEAREIADLVMTTLRAGKPLPDYDAVRQWQHTGCLAAAVPTVGEYLTGWLAGLHLDANTIRGYESHVRVHLIPHLGHLRLDQLVAEDIRAMFVAIRQSAPEDAAQATATRPRPTGPGTCERIRATLRKALNDAVTDRLIPDNPVTYVRLPSAPRARPRLWTDERVGRWRETGEIPGPVMVWTPRQTGIFLDHAARHDPELYPLLHLIAYRGLRRGEAVGLLAADADLGHGRLHITHQITTLGWTPHRKRPKGPAGERIVELDAATTGLLRAYRTRQRGHAASDRRPDSDLFFTQPDGTPWHPTSVSRRFKQLATQPGLPPIRLHDLRHGAATLAQAAGAGLKDIQAMLGHSRIEVTADTYTTVLPQRARAIAEAAAAALPRHYHPARLSTYDT